MTIITLWTSSLLALTLIGCPAPTTDTAGPSLEVSPASLDFGTIAPGSTAQDTLQLTNAGSAAIALDHVDLGGADAAEFVATPLDVDQLDAGASATATIAYQPTALGQHSAQWRVFTDASGDAALTASLTGVSDCDVDQHVCDGVCADDDALATCGDSCAPCPTDPHGTATCDGSACAVQCDTGWHDDGAGCVADAWRVDPTTSLWWQEPGAGLFDNWLDAVAYCDGLTLGGHDDWRMPNIDELRSLIRGCSGTVTGGACAVHDGSPYGDWTNGACSSCATAAGPGPGGCYWDDVYGASCTGRWWSSSSSMASQAWFVEFSRGNVYSVVKYDTSNAGNQLRCVRTGP